MHPEARPLLPVTPVSVEEEGCDGFSRGRFAHAVEADMLVPDIDVVGGFYNLDAEEAGQEPEQTLEHRWQGEVLPHVLLAQPKPILEQALPPIRQVGLVDVLRALRCCNAPKLRELALSDGHAAAADALEEREDLPLRRHAERHHHVHEARLPNHRRELPTIRQDVFENRRVVIVAGAALERDPGEGLVDVLPERGVRRVPQDRPDARLVHADEPGPARGGGPGVAPAARGGHGVLHGELRESFQLRPVAH
mmetsp:Transcript_55578/g.169010  ORF Transcript_55578/g.169010 Transcript_55578/m.169010 type:complete len:251 (-) Transcript_55578:793-1545(-)